MKPLKLAGLAAALALSFSAYAVQKDITVVTDIDPTLELLQADGSALPQVVRLNFVPGLGLQAHSIQTKIFSNATNKDINMRLVNAPVLAPVTDPSATSIPLAVQYNQIDLTTTNKVFKAADIFTATAATPGSSIAMPLSIGAGAGAPAAGAMKPGSYQGTVSILLTQVTP